MEDEKKYLKYGQDEIEELSFLNNAANNLENYLSKLAWSPKRKELFRLAYLNIMSRGIIGADNSTGSWVIQHNGDAIPMEGLSKKEKEMYGEAAYYIQSLMSGLPTRKKEEEDKNKDKKTLTNEEFIKGLNSHIGNTRFGGILNWASNWNDLDLRGENGLRGIDNRKKELRSLLESYGNSLTEDLLDFKDTPFTDYNDFKTRLQGALNALDTPSPDDDNEALLRLGIDPKLYLGNGANDLSGKSLNGNELTWGQYGEYLTKQKEAEAKEVADKLAAKVKAQQQKAAAIRTNQYKGYRFYGNNLVGKNPQELSKYGNNILSQLSGYASLGSLNGDLQSELVGAFKFAEKSGSLKNLTREELLKFGSNWQQNPSRLKKIDGLNGFYWDSIGRRVVQPYDVAPQTNFTDLINLNNPEVIALLKASVPRGNGIQLTSADKRDIAATIADLGAFIDPEMVTGTGMALTASGLRTYNSVLERGLWDTITDWKTWADWGTGALGGTALLGDASSIVKFARGLGKLMTIPAVINAINSIPEAKQALSKIDSNNLVESVKKLTPADYHAISNVLVGVLSGKNYVKGNLVERRVLQESGINTTAKTKRREYANKYGLTRTKPNETTLTPTAKVKINDEEVEIKLSKDLQTKLLEKIKKAGNSEEARNNAIKEELKGKEYTTTSGKKIKVEESSKISAIAPKSVLDRSWVPSRFGTSRNIFGNTTESIGRGNDNFENWLNNRSTWDLWKPWGYGTNSNLRRIYNLKGLSQLLTSTNNTSNSNISNENTTSNNSRNLLSPEDYIKELRRLYKEILSKHSGNNLSEEPFTVDEYSFKADKFPNSENGFFDIHFGNNHKTISFKNLEDLRKLVLQLFKESKSKITSSEINKKENAEKIGKILKELKARGVFRQGGKLDREQINKYKEFLNK